MSLSPRQNLALVFGIALIGISLPLALYWLAIGRAPDISPVEARRLLSENSALLVDVTGQDPASCPDAQFRWNVADILRAQTPADLPEPLRWPARGRGQKILLLCTGGIRSAQAAAHLRSIGVPEVFSIRGGMQDWVAADLGCPRGVLLRADPAGDARLAAFRPSPVGEQWVAVLTFFGVKFLYSVISAALALVLWRRAEPDLAALRRAMICFFVGEAFCFVNVMVFFEHSLLLEYLHSAGMVLAFAFTVYALLEGLDSRLIHFSGLGRCSATALCRGCIKAGDAACGLRRIFLALLPATALLAGIPLCSSLRDTAYNTRIFGVLHAYRHPVVHQIYELRILPILALILLAAAFLVLLLVERREVSIAKILFSAAAGALGFSLMRLILVACFVDNQVWFAAWEEITELLYVGLAGATVLIFARGLLADPRAAAEAATGRD